MRDCDGTSHCVRQEDRGRQLLCGELSAVLGLVARPQAGDCRGVGQPAKRDTPLGLYLHIPFCRKRCKFCYFRVYTDKNADEVEVYLKRWRARSSFTPVARGSGRGSLNLFISGAGRLRF